MATHSRVLAWKTLWTVESGRLWFTGLQRVGDNCVTKHTHTSVKDVCMQTWAKASLVRGGKGSERVLSHCVDLKCLHQNHLMKCRNYPLSGQSHLSVGGVSISASFIKAKQLPNFWFSSQYQINDYMIMEIFFWHSFFFSDILREKIYIRLCLWKWLDQLMTVT